MQIVKDIRRLNTHSLSFAEPLAVGVLKGMRKRFKAFLDQTEEAEDALLATMSLPNFKDKIILGSRKEEMTRILIRKAENLAKNDEFKPESVKEGADDYFDLTDEEGDLKSPELNKIASEVYKYLADKDKSLECLHRYPSVKRVFLRLVLLLNNA